MTQTALAKRIGFVRNYISIIENGKEPSHRFIRALELLEQGPVQYNEHSELVRDEEYGAARRSLVVEPGRSGVALRVIPLLSWAQAGTAEAWTDLEGREGFVGFNVEDPRAVAVRIRGDGMEPRFPQGTIAIVYPGWEAKSRDLVIARLKDGTVIFARLQVDGNHYTFISLNEIYPPLTVEKSKVEKVLAVGGTYQSHL